MQNTAKQNYPSSLAYYDTRPGNEMANMDIYRKPKKRDLKCSSGVQCRSVLQSDESPQTSTKHLSVGKISQVVNFVEFLKSKSTTFEPICYTKQSDSLI